MIFRSQIILLFAIYAYIKVIAPVEGDLGQEQQEFWKQQRKVIADLLIAEISSEKLECNKDNIEHLKKLDERFADFPDNGGLEEFKKRLQPSEQK